MDILCRHVCTKCGGTGKNNLSDSQALKLALDWRREFRTGVFLSTQDMYQTSIEEAMKRLQTCSYCEKGYNEVWLSAEEVLGKEKGNA